MVNIENIFKNQVYFQGIYDNSVVHEGLPFICKTLLYKTMLIQDPQSMCLDNVDDIYRKVEPFIRYLVSEHRTMEPEGSRYVESSFGIGIFIRDDDLDHYKKLVTVNANIYSGMFDYEPEYLEN